MMQNKKAKTNFLKNMSDILQKQISENLLFFISAITAVQAPQSPEAQPSFVPFKF